MLEIKTDDTYEASWYILNGGVLKEIEFGRVPECKWKKEGFKTSYILTIVGVEPRFERYWKQFRPIGNIRQFANVRRNLKRKIKKIERRK
jgi:hypothetical protein